MIKKELAKVDQNKIIEVYENYQIGEITKDSYLLFLLDLLENYIKDRIEKKHRTVGAEYEDLMQQGRLAVITMADRYDPHITMPSSFFTDYIDQYMKDILNNEGMTKYYVGTATKLEKVAREYGYTGCTDPRLTPDTLAVLADTSLMTVLETLKYKQQTIVSLEATSDNMDIEDNVFKNPEKSLIDAERSEFINKQLKKCSPLEQYLLGLTVLAETPKSYRTLVKELKKPEIFALFKSELPPKIEQVFLEQKVNHALRRIKYNPTTKRFASFSEEPVFDVIEQATDKDIENAILANLEDLKN